MNFLKGYIRIIKAQWSVLIAKLRDEFKRQSFLRKYVPKYGTRTIAEHEAIRLFIKRGKDCDHLKGGRARHRFQREDFNVMLHTYIDGSKRIRCGSCGKVVRPADAEWDAWMKMVSESTNRPSSSEQPMLSVIRDNGTKDEYRTVQEMKAVFPKWNGSSGPFKEKE
jgi:hypothetical protein